MDLVTINQTDLKVSPVCMGTATLGSTLDEEESFQRLDMFYEAGGRFLDTSNIYADWVDGAPKSASEKTVGKWLKSRRLDSPVVVATKGGHGELHGTRIGRTRLHKEELHEQIQRSLSHLCTDSIGLYYLHRDDPSIPVEQIMDTLFESIDRGDIRHIGCSNWSPERMRQANEYAKKCRRTGFAVSSDRWSLARFKPDPDPSIVPFCRERLEYLRANRLTEVPFQSMGRGTLSLIADGKRPEENYDLEENYALAKTAAEIAEEHHTTVAAISVAYLVNQPIRVIPILFFDNEPQIKEAFSGAGIRLSVEEMKRLTRPQNTGR